MFLTNAYCTSLTSQHCCVSVHDQAQLPRTGLIRRSLNQPIVRASIMIQNPESDLRNIRQSDETETETPMNATDLLQCFQRQNHQTHKSRIKYMYRPPPPPSQNAIKCNTTPSPNTSNPCDKYKSTTKTPTQRIDDRPQSRGHCL